MPGGPVSRGESGRSRGSTTSQHARSCRRIGVLADPALVGRVRCTEVEGHSADLSGLVPARARSSGHVRSSRCQPACVGGVESRQVESVETVLRSIIQSNAPARAMRVGHSSGRMPMRDRSTGGRPRNCLAIEVRLRSNASTSTWAGRPPARRPANRSASHGSNSHKSTARCGIRLAGISPGSRQARAAPPSARRSGTG